MLGVHRGDTVAEFSPGSSIWTCDSVELMGSKWKNEMGSFFWGPQWQWGIFLESRYGAGSGYLNLLDSAWESQSINLSLGGRKWRPQSEGSQSGSWDWEGQTRSLVWVAWLVGLGLGRMQSVISVWSSVWAAQFQGSFWGLHWGTLGIQSEGSVSVLNLWDGSGASVFWAQARSLSLKDSK